MCLSSSAAMYAASQDLPLPLGIVRAAGLIPEAIAPRIKCFWKG